MNNRKKLIKFVSRLLYFFEIDRENLSKIIAGMTDLVYVSILGTDASGFRTQLGISNKAALRKYLEKNMQEEIDKIEGAIAQDILLAVSKEQIKKPGDILYFFMRSLLHHTATNNIRHNAFSDIKDPIEFYKITNQQANENKWTHIQELYQVFRAIKNRH